MFLCLFFLYNINIYVINIFMGVVQLHKVKKDIAYGGKSFLSVVYSYRYLYILMLPGLLYFIIFKYAPIYGLQLAFKNYKAGLGISGSPWVGAEHFINLFSSDGFLTAFKNTIIISLLKVICGFPLPVILTLLINELRGAKTKRVLQTVYTFPHFLSWVIVSGMCFSLFNSDGVVNQLITVLGGEKQQLLTEPKTFRGFLVFTAMWKESGWGTILYLAAVTSIDASIYEAAKIDGAGRWQSMLHITLPGISSMIIVNLILSCGNVMDAGFDQIFNMYNSSVMQVSDILDTFVYRISFKQTPNFGFSTAVGLFKGVANLVILLSINKLVKLTGKEGIV